MCWFSHMHSASFFRRLLENRRSTRRSKRTNLYRRHRYRHRHYEFLFLFFIVRIHSGWSLWLSMYVCLCVWATNRKTFCTRDLTFQNAQHTISGYNLPIQTSLRSISWRERESIAIVTNIFTHGAHRYNEYWSAKRIKRNEENEEKRERREKKCWQKI